jgi:hypothetical protein
MLQRATLEGVPGVVDLRFRLQRGVEGEWLGTFFFQPDDQPTLTRLTSDCRAVLETTLEEARRTLPVTITSCTPGGVALFQSDKPSVPAERPRWPTRGAPAAGGPALGTPAVNN